MVNRVSTEHPCPESGGFELLISLNLNKLTIQFLLEGQLIEQFPECTIQPVLSPLSNPSLQKAYR
jgi:hypothetical protein